MLIADDHGVVTLGLRVLLGGEPDLEIVGEAEDGRKAVAAAATLRPDVVVMDIAMPVLNGIEATRQILAAAPHVRVLLLSAHNDVEYLRRIAEIGAAGYILKSQPLEILAGAIRSARAGRFFVGPDLPAVAGDSVATLSQAVFCQKPLTVREAEMLQLIAEGKANKQSAALLGISIKTVEKHRQSLMTKLDIHDVAGLTRYAIAIGAIEGRHRAFEA